MTVTSTGLTSAGESKATRGRAAGRGASGPAAPQICPLLIAEDGSWRSTRPARAHRCGAVAPPAPLALDKQRRLCLVQAHVTCATRLAAVGLAAAEGSDHGGAPIEAGAQPALTESGAVTRWSIVRTAPVVLDAGAGTPEARGRSPRATTRQVALGGLLALALGAVLLGRLPQAQDSPQTPVPPAAAQASIEVPAAGTTPSQRPTRAPRASSQPVAIASASAPATVIASSSPSPLTYRVRAGDTLYAIASHFGTTVEALQTLNDLGESTMIRIGQVLRLR